MLTKSITNISEFTDTFRGLNSVRVQEPNLGNTDPLGTVYSDCDGIQQAPPASNFDKFQQFQSVKNKTFFDQFPISKMHTEADADETEDLVVMQAGQNLSSIPPTLMSQRLQIRVLDLSKNEFTEFPRQLLEFVYLQSLKMDSNKLRSIPAEIADYKMLEALSLYGNKIDSLPMCLPKLAKLKFLDLGSNYLRSFGAEITNIKSLQTLNIYHNKLCKLPVSFKNLKNLTEFRLEWFRYTIPALNVNQKEEEGEKTLKDLRQKLSELAAKRYENIDFENFVALLSTEKVDLARQDSQNRTVMHSACFYGDTSVIEFLSINYPFLIQQEDTDGFTPFCLGLLGDKPTAVNFLLSKNLDFTKGGGKHGSILHIATKFLNIIVVKDLIQRGDDINKLDAGGNTPLHYSISMMAEGYNEAFYITQYLLEHGANPNVKNKENWTAMHLAVRKRHIRAVDWILSYNFEVREIHGGGEAFKLNKKGGMYSWTNLHIATYSEAPEMITALAGAKIDPFKRSLNGFTAKKIIKRNGLALKLIEKYERDWLKANILNKKPLIRVDAISTDLTNLQKGKGVKKASKNVFGELQPQSPGLKIGGGDFSYIFKTRIEMLAPNIDSHRHKTRDSDSIELDPELETYAELDNLNISEQLGVNFHSEINERNHSNCVSADIYSSADDGFQNTTHRIPDNGEQGLKQFIRERMGPQVPIHFCLDLYQYKRSLENETKLDLITFAEEVRKLQEILVSERLIFEEKLKALTAMKILHKNILANVYKNFSVPYPPETFSVRVEEYINAAVTDPKAQIIKNRMVQINSFYELVPEALIAICETLDPKLSQNVSIKMRICGILQELKYFPAISFFQHLVDSWQAVSILGIEAAKNQNNLKAYFTLDNTEKQVKSAYHAFLRNQYAKMPSTKKRLAPVLKLEKNV